MPQEVKREPRRSHHTGSRWHRFHFSGKVIMCSVLFGLGLVLIGGLIFAIASDSEDKPKSDKDSEDIDISTKAPTSFVGSAIMGIGGFIVVVGIIMCLFETEVCRKRSADSSPLISEGQNDSEAKESEPAVIPSTSKGHANHRHGARKKSPSPRGHKGASRKPHSSKDRSHKKASSPSSPPMEIEKSNKFLTTSDDKFITPPNTLLNEPMVMHSNPHDAENQTTSSLMKSFTSSGPSWNVSTEFQTPATSFGDASPSFEDSTRISEMESSMSSVNTQIPDRQKIIPDGFLTPMTPPDEKVRNLSSDIQKCEAEVVKEHETIKEGYSQNDPLNAQEIIKNNGLLSINSSQLSPQINSQGFNTDQKSQSCGVQIENKATENEQEDSNQLPLTTAEKSLNDDNSIPNSSFNDGNISQPIEESKVEPSEPNIVVPNISLATDPHSTEYMNVKNDEMLTSEVSDKSMNDTTDARNLSYEIASNEDNHGSESIGHLSDRIEVSEDEVPSTVINIPENSKEHDNAQNQFSDDTEKLVDQNLNMENKCDVEHNANQILTLSHGDKHIDPSIKNNSETFAETAIASNIESVPNAPEDNPEETTNLCKNESHSEFPICSTTQTETGQLISKDSVNLDLNEKVEESPKVDSS